jgi:hypothetical protein
MPVQMRKFVESPSSSARRGGLETVIRSRGGRRQGQFSPLALGSLQRAAIATGLVILIWAAVAWALWS